MGANDLENDDLLYSFLMTSSDGRYFTMNISSGVISTTMPIDREVCGFLFHCKAITDFLCRDLFLRHYVSLPES